MRTDLRSKAIIHLDMDAFYAAIEVLDNPYLKAWGEAAKDLLEKPTEITLWEMISE